MSLSELIPAIRALPREDQQRLLALLRRELEEDGETLPLTEGEYPVWSPHDAHEAAATLLEVLQDAAAQE